MGNLIDLSGQRFGMLTVIERASNDKSGSATWQCKCDCGNKTVVTSGNLRSGKQKSCGCLRHRPTWNRTHGESRNSRLYKIWTGMKTRCNNPNCKAYANYGGRGIALCDPWNESYATFRDWAVLSGYSDKLSIDRIDNSKGYSPDNCRWATARAQSNNRRSNRHITVNGAQMTTADAARLAGVSYGSFMKKLYKKAGTNA